MKQKIFINKIILDDDCKGKKKISDMVNYITGEVKQQKILPMKRAFINFQWFEYNANRTLYDITLCGRKIILLSLIKAGILESDERSHIIGFRDTHFISHVHPGIYLYLDDFNTVAEPLYDSANTRNGI